MRLTRSEQPSSARSEAAARRLALLAADLSGELDGGQRGRGPVPVDPGADQHAEADASWWADHTRVAQPAQPIEPPTAEPPVVRAPELPLPGRHAVRRPPAPPVGRGAGLRRVVRGWSPAHLTVVALLVATGLAISAWWVARDRPADTVPTPIAAAPALVTTGQPTGADASAPTSDPSETGEVTVDVAGKVKRPGIVVLAAGSRVVDAVEAAGGARRGVDLSGINLARVLIDGEQILVGAAGAGVPAGSPPEPSGSAAPAGELVNLNLATVEQLEELPEVGPVTAAAIVSWREEHGGFTSVDDLLEVSGIGQATLEQIRPYATV